MVVGSNPIVMFGNIELQKVLVSSNVNLRAKRIILGKMKSFISMSDLCLFIFEIMPQVMLLLVKIKYLSNCDYTN